MSVKQTPAQLEAHKKYMTTLDEFKIRVEKGMKDQYKTQAAARGLSLNAYVVSLLERDGYLLEQEKKKKK